MPNRRPLDTMHGRPFRFPVTAASPNGAGEIVYARGEDGTICFVNVKPDGLYLTSVVADDDFIVLREGVEVEEIRTGTIMVVPAGSLGKRPSRISRLLIIAAIAGGIAWWIWG